MKRDPSAFFRFAGKRFPLLAKLFYTEHGFSDGELYSLVSEHISMDDPSVEYIIEQLSSLMIIDEVPGETARWELTHPVRSLLRFLLREQRLTSVEVLQGYLRALESSRGEILSCIRDGNRNGVLQGVSDVSETVERLRRDSADNYSAILTECMKMKSGEERKTPLERFETVNRLWSRYLMPMQDLISVDKSIEEQLDGMESALASGIVRFGKYSEMVEMLNGARARILRMRRETTADFHNALADILPLYRSLKADSEFARGASAALRKIEKEGVQSLHLDSRLSVSTWRAHGLLSESDIRSLLYELSGYTPGSVVSALAAEGISAAVYRSLGDVLLDLERSLPVADLLSWLNDYCLDGKDASEVLRLYGGVFSAPPGKVIRGREQRIYNIKGVEMKSYPLGLAAE